ncbi:MAG: CoA pyrophosphatase [Desulfitobacteriaceae bacterium]|nr:CoA pyrophosphatase [Desulfitobacteriaceae bacterium]
MKIGQINDLKKILPAIPGINGQENYFQSAVMILLAWFSGEYHFIFEKRCAKIRQAGEICFPGGRFEAEKDKDFCHAALRETREELGLSQEKVDVLGRLNTVVTPKGVIVETFLGFAHIENLDDLTIDPEEVAEVFSLPVTLFEKYDPDKYLLPVTVSPVMKDSSGKEIIIFPAAELALGDNYTQPWRGMDYPVYVYKFQGRVIWGITARIIYDLVQRIKQFPTENLSDS